MTAYMITALVVFFIITYWSTQTLCSVNERSFLMSHIPYLADNWDEATAGIIDTPLIKHVWRRATFRNPWRVYPAATQYHAHNLFNKKPEAKP